MTLFFYSYIGIIGLVLGSFYNVVGLRIPENQSVVRPRSQCPACKKTLTATDLVPVLSYVFLRGKCRNCHSKIPPLYPLIELSTGLLFMLAFYEFGMTGEFVIALLFISLLVIIFVSDIVYMIIPNKVLLFFVPIVLVARLVVPLDPLWDMFVGAVVGFGLLFFIAVISKGGMGGGDVKLFFVLGLVLGLKLTILTFALATFLGALYGVAGMIRGKYKKRQPIPFGPFIAIGALLSYFYGAEILSYYFTMFE
ncbi:prepilin peptidase [Peribacillus huizhouensis]|uniref:Leader peptidase (Prepilin peptidase)/N-methyltransferase n=1 Tax=Peribacillus huizhouensis TaxID=1501239 RepID=A0ABR6CMY0_9BACI|nr:A24 family peptidase [Peribacillus huizhouensis]MBA9025737.1 leader peptidase (prepilin peptidase)/N-methyltransferase [Peribacillus huizhouensis]